MPEIIDLCSSTPVREPSSASSPTKAGPPSKLATRTATSTVDSAIRIPSSPSHHEALALPSDEFDTSLFDYGSFGDFADSDHSAKKRRLSPRLGPGLVGRVSVPVTNSRKSPVHDREQARVQVSNVVEADVDARDRDPQTRTDNIPSDLFSFLSDDDSFLPACSNDKTTSTTTTTATATRRSNTYTWNGTRNDIGEESTKSTRRSNTYTWNGEESDPIVFTSSAPEPQSRTRASERTTQKETIILDDDDIPLSSFPDDPFSFSQQDATTANVSDRTANLLATIESRARTKSQTKSTRTERATSTRPSASTRHSDRSKLDQIESDIGDAESHSTKPKPKPRSSKSTNKLTDAEKQQRAQDREAAKVQREKEKEEEKQRKQQAKEEKAKAKQLAADIAEVNRLKIDKKTSTPEMITDISSSLENASVGNQIVEFMKHLGVETTFFPSQPPGLIRWRRKVIAKFNEEAGHWEPCPLEIKREAHILCLLTAKEFVDMLAANIQGNSSPDSSAELEANLDMEPESRQQSLSSFILQLRSQYPESKPIILIEGLAAWMRKSRNSRNRAYQAAVLRQAEVNEDENEPPPSTQRRRAPKKKTTDESPPIDDDTVEDGLLELQVSHGCLVHHTAAPAESAEWIKNFTEHVSTIPYRQERMNVNDAAFCMDVGQVKSGEDKDDTFVKMLQEVNRVTAPMAYGIAARYPSVRRLVGAMREGGPSLLEDVKKSANKNGALTDSRIGPAVSKRLYKVFMGLDPTSTDV